MRAAILTITWLKQTMTYTKATGLITKFQAIHEEHLRSSLDQELFKKEFTALASYKALMIQQKNSSLDFFRPCHPDNEK